MENDKLKIMFNTQYLLQNKKNIWQEIKDSECLQQQYVNQMLLACHEEVVEIMCETAYKNPAFVPFGWKKTQVWNTEKYKDEIVDLWHFVMNLSLVVGMEAEEFFDRYMKKNKENIARDLNGY